MRDAYQASIAKLHDDPSTALAELVAIAQAAPAFWPARFRVVDALVTLGESDAAAALLRALGEGYAKIGQPVPAILACKLLEAMGRDSDAINGEIAMIYAGLFGQELVPAATPIDPPPGPTPAPVSDALNAAQALGNVGDALPEKYPAVPLLSRLTPEDFIVVLRAMKMHVVGHASTIVKQGAQGSSCFLVLDGTLVASRTTDHGERALGRLTPGTIFGEMALVSQRPRNASITSVGGSIVLELNKATMLAHSKAMKEAMYAFSRRRLLENITLTSPLLRTLDRKTRQSVVGLFGAFAFRPGQALVTEGEKGQGLFVVLRGSVSVMKKRDGAEVELATLKEGDLFGEISLLRDTPTTASVRGADEGEVLFLDRSDFQGLIAAFPHMQTELASLSEERLRSSELILENIEDDEALALI